MKLALTIHTGYSKFPNIYFGEDHVGGLDDLHGLLMTNDSIGEAIVKHPLHPENKVELPLSENLTEINRSIKKKRDEFFIDSNEQISEHFNPRGCAKNHK